MKFLLTFLFIALLSGNLYAQNNQDLHHQDLEFLYQTLRSTPGYKAQIKGEKLKAYQALYNELKKASIGPTTLDTFYTYSQLLWPIKDMHLGLQQVWDYDLNLQMLSDSSYISNYRKTPAFQQFPRSQVSLDSLEKELRKKPNDSIEGIYQAGNLGSVGIYRTSKADSLVGVILTATYRNSAPGQLFAIFKETAPGKYRAVHANLLTRSLVYARNVGFNKGMFNQLSLRKATSGTYAELWSQESYLFKNLSATHQYLYLGNFHSFTNSLRHAKTFHDRIKDSLTAANLILDLRGNSGGGEKSSTQFLQLIRNYAKKGKVSVLVNRFSMSHAERFTLELKKINGLTVYGETTAGIIAYGKNTDQIPILPSKRFRVYNTDMKDPADYLIYEEIGIQPDVFLDESADWIQQVLRLSSANE